MIGCLGAAAAASASLPRLRGAAQPFSAVRSALLPLGLMGILLLRVVVLDAPLLLRYASDGGSSKGAGPAAGSARRPGRPHLAVPQRREVEWLSMPADFPGGEVYSACWYMPVDTFRQVDTGPESVGNQEAAVFAAFRGREPLVRMSLDYLDLSVEHLSHFWRMVDVLWDETAYRYAVGSYSAYIARHVHQQPPFPYRYQQDKISGEDATVNPLHPTVAAIAFSQRKDRAESPLKAERAGNLSSTSLGAVVASLVQVGVGRVVVVGSDPSDEYVVQDAFRLLKGAANLDRVHPREGPAVTQVHDTQLAFVLVQGDLLNSTYNENNIPRAALAGLQRALQESDPAWTRRWLGDEPRYWKYVYYTEGDSILQTRPSALPHLRRQLDAGLILNPHRFQMIAYDGDVPGRRKVPVGFKTPITLNSDEVVDYPDGSNSAESRPGIFQHCCGSPDGSGSSGSNRPAFTDFPSCGTYWYECGFGGGGGRNNHSRLEPYDFIVLSHGTGTTTLASTEQGRRCVPSTVPCRRRTTRPPAE